MNIGEKIKDIRLKNNLTQQELGDKLFVSDKTISSWESGRTLPDINTIIEISKIFDISVVNLINNTNDKNIEIELKIKVDRVDYNVLLKKIKESSEFVKEEDQSATYFKPKYREFNNEWLRIRKEDKTNVLNYKSKNEADEIEEYEVLIDNFDNLKTIFNQLDLYESINVNKHRISYLYKDKYEISFDEVEKLGLFIEIEVKKYEFSNQKELELLLNLINELNLNINNISTKRYPELMEETI